MASYKIGFVGAGKMASAIIKGLIKTGFAKPEELIATQAEKDLLEEKSKILGIKVISDNKELAQCAETVFIATKPNQVADVLAEISPYINSEKLVVSIAAGVTTEKLEAGLPSGTRVIRVMPNTPALVGEGMSGMVGGKNAKKEDLEFIKELLSTIGKCIVVDNEAQIDIVTAISGSGPAFFYKVINEIARAAEKLGLDLYINLKKCKENAEVYYAGNSEFTCVASEKTQFISNRGNIIDFAAWTSACSTNKGNIEKTITSQSDLKEDEYYNITAIHNNTFGNNAHIHLGGK